MTGDWCVECGNRFRGTNNRHGWDTVETCGCCSRPGFPYPLARFTGYSDREWRDPLTKGEPHRLVSDYEEYRAPGVPDELEAPRDEINPNG